MGIGFQIKKIYIYIIIVNLKLFHIKNSNMMN